MRDCVLWGWDPEKYCSPWALERALAGFVEDDTLRRYHEARQNVTPAHVYHGRRPAMLARREPIKQRTRTARRRENLRTPHHAAQQPDVSLLKQPQAPVYALLLRRPLRYLSTTRVYS